ncbi:MAG: hypothetical protein JW999_00080 [Methanotrichaceae archaeon]|nr:hypothetical protein [Methanotrichaceae archaeon]
MPELRRADAGLSLERLWIRKKKREHKWYWWRTMNFLWEWGDGEHCGGIDF